MEWLLLLAQCGKGTVCFELYDNHWCLWNYYLLLGWSICWSTSFNPKRKSSIKPPKRKLKNSEKTLQNLHFFILNRYCDAKHDYSELYIPNERMMIAIPNNMAKYFQWLMHLIFLLSSTSKIIFELEA